MSAAFSIFERMEEKLKQLSAETQAKYHWLCRVRRHAGCELMRSQVASRCHTKGARKMGMDIRRSDSSVRVTYKEVRDEKYQNAKT
jgi:hypothetical protein